MTYKTYILVICIFISGRSASAQVSNRAKVTTLLLSESRFKLYGINKYEMQASSPDPTWGGSSPRTSTMEIPRYTLPKCNVFCRLEDYVQMHTPMKLNIGVGGQ